MRLLFSSRPAWLGARPLVYLALDGRSANVARAIEVLGRLEVDVLVALGSASDGDLDDLPANVRVEAFVDQAAVLPHADLVVHHGGTGMVLAALAHGRRQLLLPTGADQFVNADALRAAGLAAVLEPEEATAEAIEAAVRAALAAPVPPALLAARDEIAAIPA
jgi:UDP:flavonoid glycosyltransferase YjiC (YdhE family)